MCVQLIKLFEKFNEGVKKPINKDVSILVLDWIETAFRETIAMP